MMTDIPGCDISAWQGKAGIDFNIDKMWESGMRYVVMKATQGPEWKDKVYLYNYAAFRANSHPWKLGAYHFTDTGNGLAQAANFLSVVKDTPLDFPLFQDVEFYTSATVRAWDNHAVVYGDPKSPEDGLELLPVLDYRRPQPSALALLMPDAPKRYNYSITTEAIVDVIARKLAGFGGWAESAVYTNKYSGDTVFKKAVMSRLHLFDAYWSTTATAPLLPNVWKAANKWMMWQYGVDAGSDHGFPGSLDHDRWGNELPFPGDVPAVESMQWRGLIGGEWWCGEIKKERC